MRMMWMDKQQEITLKWQYNSSAPLSYLNDLGKCLFPELLAKHLRHDSPVPLKPFYIFSKSCYHFLICICTEILELYWDLSWLWTGTTKSGKQKPCRLDVKWTSLSIEHKVSQAAGQNRYPLWMVHTYWMTSRTREVCTLFTLSHKVRKTGKSYLTSRQHLYLVHRFVNLSSC